MNQRRRYNRPPIEEAVCEFRFQPGEEWNLTIPGKLQSEIGGDYTGKPQEQRVIDLDLQTAGDRPPGLGVREGLAKVQLVTKDGRRKVGVGKDVLSIHMLRPYQKRGGTPETGWEEFRPRIVTALDAYWTVARPRGVSRIGIRYINKICVSRSQPPIRVEDYLKCAPPDVQGLPNRMSNYLGRVEYRYDDSFMLILSHGTVNAPPGLLGFLLDIDVISEMSDSIDRDAALQVTSTLREREREAFELLITDQARELFNAD